MAVRKAISDGADVVIGGDTAVSIATEAGVPSLFLSMTEDSMRQAFSKAENMEYAMNVEKKTAAQLETLLDYSYSGVIRLDGNGVITAVNPLMEDMIGKKVMVTAGPTQEKIDPVRYITNHSTGRMGYAIARVCMQRGAEVTLVTGPSALKKPEFVQTVAITSAKEMFDEVTSRASMQDIIIKAAAVADYRPKYVSDQKMKKKDDDMILEMERTDDIIAYLGAHKPEKQFLCGFSMETEHMLENSRKKLKKKNLDMIVANSLKVEGAGFGGDTNVVTIITEEKEEELGKMSKEDTAAKILDYILEVRK